MTLLTALNDVQRLVALPVTSSIVADGQETQNLLYALSNRSAKALMRRHIWPALRREHTWTMSLASLQASGKPTDFGRMVSSTMWNRTSDRQIGGPIDEKEWGIAYGRPFTSSIAQYFMLRYDGLHIFPAPSAADTGAYEYMINTPVLASDGVTYKTDFSADTDSFVLDEEMLLLDVRWRWLQSRGLDYAEAMRDAELRIQSEINAKRGIRALSLAPPDIDELGEGLIPETGFVGAP